MADVVTPRPHRGVMILVFGIVGLTMCFPLGIAACLKTEAKVPLGMSSPRFPLTVTLPAFTGCLN